MSDIFISYASEDRDRARMLAEALEDQGWSVWWDRTVPPGKTFDEVIEAALDAGSCVIVLWSEAAVASQRVRAEAGEGLKRGILIPVLIEDVEPPLAFRQIDAAGLIDWQGESAHPGFGQLVGVVSGILGQPIPDKEKRKAEPDETRKDAEKEPETIGSETAKRRRLWIAAAAVVLAVGGAWGVYQYNVRIAEIRTQEEMHRVALEEERRKAAEEARGQAEEKEKRKADEEARRQAEEEARREKVAVEQQERVQEAQRLLAELGYTPGPADGKEGAATERAIMRFKRNTGLSGGPVIDELLLIVLRDAAEARTGETPGRRAAGKPFRDCPECPEMVVVPTGRFVMGSPGTEHDRDNDEGPRHQVTISRSIAVGKYEITFEQWDACVAGGGCGGYRPPDRGWDRGRQPVINVSWEDAKAYVAWLREKTGKPYRLLSEAEWEYAARAGSTTRYWWGDDIGWDNANCRGCGSPWDGKRTAPAGRFRPNGFRLYDMAGNVWEWVEDCWNGSYEGAPTDGSAWMEGNCDLRVLRGGSWGNIPGGLRSAIRGWNYSDRRDNDIGFRVVGTMP
jgi:formylglycine-generating enzyme required for sulfatase activity